MTMRRKAIVVCAVILAASPTPAEPAKTWKMLQFLAGPPHPGQVTDTLEITDVGGSFKIELKRDITGEKSARYCAAKLKDTFLEKKLRSQLLAEKLAWAFEHSAMLPRLIPDSGYFRVENQGRSIFAGNPPAIASSPEIVSAVDGISALQNTYSMLVAHMLKQKVCKHVARPR